MSAAAPAGAVAGAVPMADGLATGPIGAAPAPAAAPARPSWTELLRRILALAAPTTLLAAVQSFGQLFETWLAARQGTAALAGWAVVLPFALLLQQMSAGAMGGGVVSAIARALGAKRPDEAAALGAARPAHRGRRRPRLRPGARRLPARGARR